MTPRSTCCCCITKYYSCRRKKDSCCSKWSCRCWGFDRSSTKKDAGVYHQIQKMLGLRQQGAGFETVCGGPLRSTCWWYATNRCRCWGFRQKSQLQGAGEPNSRVRPTTLVFFLMCNGVAPLDRSSLAPEGGDAPATAPLHTRTAYSW